MTTKFKPYLKSIVRNGGKGRLGLGVELFRLDAVAEEDLTDEEAEAAEESKDQATTTALMRIYENIGEDFWSGGGVTAKRFADELASFGNIKRLNIHINSLGGDVFTAQAIHTIISDHNSKKTSYIDGVCASAATLIACGADQVIARHNTNYMIHEPWSLAVGDAGTLRKAAADLDAVTVPILSVYKEQVKGKISDGEIRQLMADETWMSADEALEYGFVDEVRGKINAIAKVGKSQIMCCGQLMDVGRYHYKNVPKYPAAKAKAEAATTKNKDDKRKETIIMTKEEIDPALLASVEAEAKTAERTRLAALDAMSAPGLEEIIAKAKAEGKQPQDIALDCFNVAKSALASANQVNALAKDASAAGGIKAGDAPMPKVKENSSQRGSRLIANAFDSFKPKAVARN
jgi:ATP-dependent Clp protease protease subunit